MRVLLVSSSSGSQGGGEIYLGLLAHGLTELGHQVSVVLADAPRMDGLQSHFPKDIRIYRLPFKRTYDRRFRSLSASFDYNLGPLLRRNCNLDQFDIIHLNRQNLEDGLDWLNGVSRLSIPSISTIHVTRSMKSLGAIAGAVRDIISRKVMRRSNVRSLAISPQGQLDIANFLSVPTNQVLLAANGVRKPNSNRLNARQLLGVAQEDFVIGVVARVESQKNPFFLVEKVLPHLPPRVKLIWVGDGSLRKSLEDKALSFGVAERLRILGWRSDTLELYAGFDVFALPSLFEGLPLAILEAMGAGLPILASDVDGIREALGRTANDSCLPVNSSSDWIKAFQRIIESQTVQREMGSQNLSEFENRFSYRTMARSTVAAYEVVLSQHGDRSNR